MKFWTFKQTSKQCEIEQEDNKIIIKNEYIQRIISLKNGCTISYKNLWTNKELIKSKTREAAIGINGKIVDIGGLKSAFKVENIQILDGTIKAFDWKPPKYITQVFPYPSLGKTTKIRYIGNTELTKGIIIEISYEVFEGMPVIRQRLDVKSEKNITVSFCETAHFNFVNSNDIHLESNYTGGDGQASNYGVSIFEESNEVSCHFDMGPDIDVLSGHKFMGMHVYELLYCSEGYENRMNELSNLYRRLCPWVNEQPIFMHLMSDKSEEIRETADKLANVGYEMIIQSFGSGINIESTDKEYIDRVKRDYDYVHSKGLEIGGYTLSIIRDYDPMNEDCATNGDHNQISRCLKTKWAKEYRKNYINFLEKTGADFIEIDGPYHFNTCTGNQKDQTEHLHKGLSDSRYTQWYDFTYDLYIQLREMGIYINAPDWFYLSGTNKCGVGYEEIAFSQPRMAQLTLNRIYNYMGTYNKIPSMGWGFLPIEQYHGGGKSACFEPLSENIAEYDWAMAEWVASGVQPCVRGKRVFDTEKVRLIVKYWLDILKSHRILLNSNTVHVLPVKLDPEELRHTKDIDIIMQANDTTDDKVFIMVFNQTEREITKTVTLPMYRTGLTNLINPPAPPTTSKPDDVVIPSFGSWPPKYKKTEDTFYRDYIEEDKTNVLLKLYENDIYEQCKEYYIDVNGNITMTFTLKPMSYVFYVGYGEEGKKTPNIPYPVERDFSLKLSDLEIPSPAKIGKVDYGKIEKAFYVSELLEAMDLPSDKNQIDGEKILLSKKTYESIHKKIIQSHNEQDATSIMFAFAQIGFYTDKTGKVPDGEVWMLEGYLV